MGTRNHEKAKCAKTEGQLLFRSFCAGLGGLYTLSMLEFSVASELGNIAFSKDGTFVGAGCVFIADARAGFMLLLYLPSQKSDDERAGSYGVSRET